MWSENNMRRRIIMSKGKRNVIIFIAALCMLMSTVAVACAGDNRANLTPSQKWKFSTSYFGAKRAYIVSGKNQSNSKHKVYFINAMYDSATKAKTPSKYTQDTIKLVGIGKSITTAVPSSSYASKKYFRLLLNPYGENTTGCTANGSQRDSK